MPVPSKTYFPQGMQERAAWFQTFMDNFTPALSLLLGFTAPERSALDDDNTDFQHIASTRAAVDNFVAAWRQYRISLCEDPVGTPTPVFPNENFSAVPVGVPRALRAGAAVRPHRLPRRRGRTVIARQGFPPTRPTS